MGELMITATVDDECENLFSSHPLVETETWNRGCAGGGRGLVLLSYAYASCVAQTWVLTPVSVSVGYACMYTPSTLETYCGGSQELLGWQEVLLLQIYTSVAEPIDRGNLLYPVANYDVTSRCQKTARMRTLVDRNIASIA